MNALFEFTASFCAVCVISAALYMLCPAGTMQKSLKYVFGLIIVVSIMSAIPSLKNITADFETKPQNTASNEEMQLLNLRLTFETALKNQGIEFSKITVCTDKSEDGSIKITKVEVVTYEDAEKVRSVLGGEDCGYTIEVYP